LSIRAGNITTQTTPQATTTSTYKGNQLTSTTTGGTTHDDWYDPLGRLTCVTTSAGNAGSCDTVTTGGTVSSAVLTANTYDFMDRFTTTSSYSTGTLTGKATYSYDALDRTAQEIENHPTANLNRTTTFSYEGLTNLVTKELQQNTGATTSTDTKTYNYDSYGHRISLNDSTVSNGTTTTGAYTYGYDVHSGVSLLVDQSNGGVKASYGYTPYGANDTTLSKGDTSVNTPFNPYRYTSKRYDSGSQTYDMGVRRFDPTTQRFLQLDQYQGALADLALSSDPLTQNRYGLAASNPLSAVEYDGHRTMWDGGGGSSLAPTTGSPASFRYPESASDTVAATAGPAYPEGFVSKEVAQAGDRFRKDWIYHRLQNLQDTMQTPEEGQRYEQGKAAYCAEFTDPWCAGPTLKAGIQAGLDIAAFLPWGRALKTLGLLTRLTRGTEAAEAGGGILANQAAGNAARDAIAAAHAGSLTEQTFSTALGARRVDVLTQNGLAIESKVGRASLTSDIRAEIAKDQWLLQNNPDITGIQWVFTRSAVTGQIGPTGPLAAALDKAGIPWGLGP